MLKSRNVFVDTQAFVQLRLRFDHPTLKRLRDLCGSGMLQLVLTETVVGEVRAKLKEHFSEAAKSLGQFHNLAGLLEQALPKGLFAKTSEDEILSLAQKAWDDYIVDSKAIVAPASAVSASDLLRMYFNSEPPFGTGKKKNEFPDAIAMLSVASWLKTNEAAIYIVSEDPDLEKWCELNAGNAFHVKSLPAFLNLYNQAEVERLTELARDIIDRQGPWVLEVIKDNFVNCGFTYVDNPEADVSDISVHSIQTYDVNVIEVDDERALVAVTVEIEFTATIEGPDYDRGTWDSEDKMYVYLPDFTLDHRFNEKYDAAVEFSFSAEKEEIDEILSVVIEDGSDITLRIDDGYPYK